MIPQSGRWCILALMPAPKTATALAAVLLIYTAIVAAWAIPHDVVTNLDFWYHVEIGRRLSLAEPVTLAHGYYPWGYPGLLRLALAAGIDTLRAAQALSWLGGALSLAGAFALACKLTGRTSLALAATLVLATNVNFAAFAAQEGNDALAAGLQIVALAVVWGEGAVGAGRAPRPYLVAGALLGLAYLTRYTALTLLPVVLLDALWRGVGRAGKLRLAAALLGAFVLAAAPQLVPSLIARGNPFYNLQAKNVWFAIYGGYDWVNRWTDVPDTITLGQVIALDPPRFFTHWAGTAWDFLATFWLWPLPLHLAWLGGLAAVALDRGREPARRVLLPLAVLVPGLALALAWLGPRFLLAPLALQAVAIAALADGSLRLINRRGRRARGEISELLPPQQQNMNPLRALRSLRLNPAALVILLLLLCAAPGLPALQAWLAAPVDHGPHETVALLRAAGMVDESEVLTNDPWLHLTDRPERTRFMQAWFIVTNPPDLADLLDASRASSRWRYPAYLDPPAQPPVWHYLVMNYAAGFGGYHLLREAALHDKTLLVPLAVSDTATVFCIQPCNVAGTQATDLRFANGMQLTGYRVFAERGVYLYWRIGARLERSYKISVRAVTPDGQTAVQVDGVPQAWTYPTTEWSPGVVIPDFYDLGGASPCRGACHLTLVVYAEDTGEPVPAEGGRVLVDLGPLR
jgi:hypothetical protein